MLSCSQPEYSLPPIREASPGLSQIQAIERQLAEGNARFLETRLILKVSCASFQDQVFELLLQTRPAPA